MSPTHTAFFYGTLLHPAILRRVIHHEGTDLEICPALLLEHTRHQIVHADYPGVVPYSHSRSLFARAQGPGFTDLAPAERSVRGTLVRGLSDEDVRLLDIFEGSEYTRADVCVHPLGPPVPLRSHAPTDADEDAYVAPPVAPALPALDALAPAVPAQTYLYTDGLAELRPELWSYEAFVRENAWKWVGRGAAANADYTEVDRRRALGGETTRAAGTAPIGSPENVA